MTGRVLLTALSRSVSLIIHEDCPKEGLGNLRLFYSHMDKSRFKKMFNFPAFSREFGVDTYLAQMSLAYSVEKGCFSRCMIGGRLLYLSVLNSPLMATEVIVVLIGLLFSWTFRLQDGTNIGSTSAEQPTN